MNFDIWASNEEQHEAHWKAFDKLWHSGCRRALVDRYPGLGRLGLHHLKEAGFECYLIDTHLDIMLQTAPPEMREDQEAITSDYIFRHLVRCMETDPEPPTLGGWR